MSSFPDNWRNDYTRLFWSEEQMVGVYVDEVRLTGMNRAEILFSCRLPVGLGFFSGLHVGAELEILHHFGPIRYDAEHAISTMTVMDIVDRWMEDVVIASPDQAGIMTGRLRAVCQWSWNGEAAR